MKAQMKAANSTGARYVLVIGDDEVRAKSITVRNLESGEQITVPEWDVLRAVTR